MGDKRKISPRSKDQCYFHLGQEEDMQRLINSESCMKTSLNSIKHFDDNLLVITETYKETRIPSEGQGSSTKPPRICRLIENRLERHRNFILNMKGNLIKESPRVWLDDKSFYNGQITNKEEIHGYGEMIRNDGKAYYIGQIFKGKKMGVGLLAYVKGKKVVVMKSDRESNWVEGWTGVTGEWIQCGENGEEEVKLFSNGIEEILEAVDAQNKLHPVLKKQGDEHMEFILEIKKNDLSEFADYIGPFKLPDGSSYEGEVKEGLRNGFGIEIGEGGYPYYAGYFINGQKIGKCLYMFLSSDKKSCTVFKSREGRSKIFKGKIYGTGELIGRNVYKGDIRESKAHGMGEVHRNGEKLYEGQFKNGLFDGTGSMYLGNEDIYIGDFKEDKIHGRGIYFFKSGKRYEGTFKNWKEDGKGKLFSPNGNLMYDGQWKQGRKTGTGVYYYCETEYYKGSFVDDKKQGEGKEYMRDGTMIFEGRFEDGKRQGSGTEYDFLGRVKFEGVFDEGFYSGKGIRHYYKDSVKYDMRDWFKGEIMDLFDCGKYIGDFKKGKLEGEGMLLYTDGSLLYKGSFKNQLFHGYGIFHSNVKVAKVQRYEGFFQNGKFNGKGTIHSMRFVCEGEFLNNNLHGRVKISYRNGEELEGNYNRGRKEGLIKQIVMVKNLNDTKKFFGDQGQEDVEEAEGLEPGDNSTANSSKHESSIPTYYKVEQMYNDGTPVGDCKIFYSNGKKMFEGKKITNELAEGNYYTFDSSCKIEGTFKDWRAYGECKFTFCNGSYYEGNCNKSKFNGKGTLYYADGTVYYGNFKGSKKHGLGVNYAENKYEVGDFDQGEKNGIFTILSEDRRKIYEGLIKDNMKNGIGVEYMTDGSQYIGSFSKGEKLGDGILKVNNGNKYLGSFLNGEIYGKGKIISSNWIDWYEGDIVDFKRNGKGVQHYDQGGYYQGSWKDDMRHGRGVDLYRNGDKYVGEFKNGLKDGKGTMYYASGAKYVGDWVKGFRHGKGVLKMKNGVRYEGEFRNNKQEGLGVIYSKLMTKKAEGRFKEGLLQGWAVIYVKNGEHFEGEFWKGKKDGVGTYYYDHGGIKYSGRWRDDKMHGKGMLYNQVGDVVYEGEFYKGKAKE